MRSKEVKATNSNGDSIQFGRHFLLLNGLNLSALQADNSYSQTTKDGASFQRSLLSVRDFDINFFIPRDFKEDWSIEEQRALAFKVFNPNFNPIRIDFVTKGGSEYYLTAELNATPAFIDDFENDNRMWLKGLLQFTAGDPYIYNAKATYADIAMWTPNFEFELEIPDGEGIEMGYRNPNLIASVYNDGGATSGMIIRFRALTTVLNPKLINVNTYEEFKLNFELQPGDVIEVNTHIGQKTAILTRNNVQSNVFNAIDITSAFLQLAPGDNLFRYDAVEGLDNLEVQIIFTSKRVGV